MNEKILSFLNKYESTVIDLTRRANTAYFDASISGNPEDYSTASQLQVELSKIYSDKNFFNEISDILHENEIDDPILKRQLKLIHNDFAMNQFSKELHKEIIKLSTSVEERFSLFRVKVDGKVYTDNEVDTVLETQTDHDLLKKVWEGSKQIGDEVADDVIKLVKLRNEAARSLGYKNYHSMSLQLSELDVETLDSLFDQLDNLTRGSFEQLKNEIDERMSAKFGIPKDELMPWHFEDKFFQLGPQIYNVSFDKYYEKQDLVKITREYFNGLGLNIDDILDKSDLFEKENKYQHAYCTDINRSGDIRVVCNIKPNHKWMSTMLHEFGHAVYDKFVSRKLPWQLRTHAHIFATESIAMLFGRLASNTSFIHDVIGIEEDQLTKIASESYKSLRSEQLLFSRWSQVMYRFEKSMYADPDQDINKLWWNLVEKYQLIKKPARRNKPDWAAKIHVALYPAYYHNYQLGELLASQLNHYICKKVLKQDDIHHQSFYNQSDVGEYLKHLFFSPGTLYKWDDLITKATGEPLTPKYYAEQFVGEEALLK